MRSTGSRFRLELPWSCSQWMDQEQFRHLPERLEVRELQYRVHRKGFRVTTIILVTTFLDAVLSPSKPSPSSMGPGGALQRISPM